MRALIQWLELDKSFYRSRWRLFGHVCLAMIIANIGLVGYRIYLAVSSDMDMTAGSDYEIARVATVPLYLPENIDGKIRMARVESLYNTASENPDHETLEEAQHCLAQAIYFEARGEPFEGWEAVGQVVINRVRDKRYPGRICDVVFQGEYRRHRCQFSFACDGVSDRIDQIVHAGDRHTVLVVRSIRQRRTIDANQQRDKNSHNSKHWNLIRQEYPLR